MVSMILHELRFSSYVILILKDQVKIDAERVNADSPRGRGATNGKQKRNNFVLFTFGCLFKIKWRSMPCELKNRKDEQFAGHNHRVWMDSYS